MHKRLLKFAVWSLPLAAVGCLGYPGPRSVENEDPAVKIPAIRRAADAGDRSVIPQLVKDLESADYAIRLAAISGLQALTRQSFDYSALADSRERRPAVQRWNNFIAGRPIDEGVETPPASAPVPPTTSPTTSPGPSSTPSSVTAIPASHVAVIFSLFPEAD